MLALPSATEFNLVRTAELATDTQFVQRTLSSRASGIPIEARRRLPSKILSVSRRGKKAVVHPCTCVRNSTRALNPYSHAQTHTKCSQTPAGAQPTMPSCPASAIAIAPSVAPTMTLPPCLPSPAMTAVVSPRFLPSRRSHRSQRFLHSEGIPSPAWTPSPAWAPLPATLAPTLRMTGRRSALGSHSVRICPQTPHSEVTFHSAGSRCLTTRSSAVAVAVGRTRLRRSSMRSPRRAMPVQKATSCLRVEVRLCRPRGRLGIAG
jgi:hypothetical protein